MQKETEWRLIYGREHTCKGDGGEETGVFPGGGIFVAVIGSKERAVPMSFVAPGLGPMARPSTATTTCRNLQITSIDS